MMPDDAQKFRVYEGVGLPPANPGPPKKWGYLPLETINIGDCLELPMDPEQASAKSQAIRNYAGRVAKKTKRKFSVRRTDYGIGIWRIK
jgi:hypothetical protein|tara:strand:+ start:1679 stop:1945 length:267 start_codon:yes stop_codon:yes gene_type:complete